MTIRLFRVNNHFILSKLNQIFIFSVWLLPYHINQCKFTRREIIDIRRYKQRETEQI